MSRLLAVLLLTYSVQSHALLYCWSDDLQAGMEMNNGQFIYTGPNGVPIANPGLALSAPFDGYCYANGQELAYIEAHFTGLTSRKGNSLRRPTDPTMYWVGDQAMFIWNQI